MHVKVAEFRQNLSHYLDECQRTGLPLLIQYGSEVFRLISEKKRTPIGSFPEKPWTIVDPDTLHLAQTSEWTPDDLL